MRITFLSILLTGCVLAESHKFVPQPNVPVPERFHNQAPGSVELQDRWWTAFGDPLLNDLIRRAETANLDVRRALARLDEAQGARGVQRSRLLPTVDSSSSVSRLRGGFNQGIARIPSSGGGGSGAFVTPFETSILSSGFGLRWEADVFGALRKNLNAATASAQAAAEAVESARVLIRSEIARSYVELRGVEEQIAVIKAELESEKDLLELIRVRADAGLATELEVERQTTQVATTTAVLPTLEQQRVATIHRLSVLLGDEPSALRQKLEQTQTQVLSTPEVPAAVPGEVLRRRPDIRQADAEITAAFARVGAARADLFPKFVITGLSGRQSTDVGGFTLGAGNFFSFGPGISLPIFNGGQIRSNIAVQQARLQESLRIYEQSVLNALEESENAYVARRASQEIVQALESARASSRRSVEMAKDLYTAGVGDYLSVLDAQRQQLQVERDLSVARTAVLRSTIALYRALGH